MVKIFFLTLLILGASSVWANCPNKIDSSKVMLFVDANYGDLEIASAQKAACARGERLEVVPKNWKQYSSVSQAVEIALTNVQSCFRRPANSNPNLSNPCANEQKQHAAAYEALSKFVKTQPSISQQLEDRMKELSQEKAKLTNISISGHDGGGHFGGSKGSISRYDVAEMMVKYPEMNEVQSLLLLGCYTGVQNEVSAWRGIFPKIKIIGGYDGSAPASSRALGHSYINNILTKEKSLLKLKNSSSVDQDVKKMITNLSGLNAAVYVDIACSEENHEFYYASELGRKFNKLNLSDCEKAQIEIAKMRPVYLKYFSGETEPPTMTASGETRSLYNKLRTYEHCTYAGNFNSDINPNGAFNLLFWHGIKQNFAHYYQKDMQAAEEILKDLNAEEMIKTLNSSVAEDEKQKEKIQADLDEFNKDPEAFKAKLNTAIQEAKQKAEAAALDPAYVDLFAKAKMIFTKEEQELVDKVSMLNAQANLLQGELYQMTQYSARYAQSKKSTISYLNETMSVKKKNIASLQDKAEMIKKIWVPTQENINKKTRKEVMENLHAINGVLSMGAVSSKHSGALSFVNSVSSQHLQYFKNPFSWHEYTGEPEAIPNSLKLSHFTNSATYSPYPPMNVGLQGGSMGGGTNVGPQLQNPYNMDERPEH